MARFLPFIFGAAVFLLGVAIDRLGRQFSENTLFTIADDILMAVIVGYMVLYYQSRRRRYLEARLKVIRDMNHHVRNALQVISYTTVKQSDEDVNRMIRDSVNRIDWALREVLPGEDEKKPAEKAPVG